MPVKRTLIFALCFACTAYAQKTYNTDDKDVYDLSYSDISKLLGWINDPKAHNLCGGYYQEDLIKYIYPKNSGLVTYRGDKSLITNKGASKLVGNVIIKQYGKKATGNVGFMYRDKQGEPKRIQLKGNMHLHAPKQLIVARSGSMELPSHHWVIENALFRNELPSKNPETVRQNDKVEKGKRRVYQLSVWGRARKIVQKKKGVTNLEDATYTSCTPACHSWHLYASRIRLDKNTGRGSAHNAVLYVKGIPVFWFPYFNFPIDHRRQTGFLSPTYGSSNKNGLDTSFPFYWNLAPNYDTTITPRYMDKRGWQFKDLFRYLTPGGSSGNLKLSWMPNDQEFESEKKRIASEYGGTAATANQTEETLNASDKRTSINWNNDTYFSPYWNAQFTYNRVSDDYFMQDFGSNQDDITENQLLQQALFKYRGEDQSFTANIQRYQTLHPLNQANVDNQYSRMPQLDYDYFPNIHPLGLDFNLGTELVNFNKNKNPYDINQASPPVGQRFNLQPSISLPMQNQFGYVTPRVQYLLTGYHVNRPGTNMQKDPGRAIPVFDLDAGMYFDRKISIGKTKYDQTLEPHIYYLYVPNRNQNDFPLFDTVDNSDPLTFNYDEMFNYNRFSGLDRIGDANQVTLAMTTRYREQNTGFQRLSASIGQIYYFDNRHVQECTASGDPASCGALPEANTQKRSPIAGIFTYNIDPTWSINGNFAYNFRSNQMENQTVNFNYRRDYRHIFNVGYTFAREGDPDQDPNTPSNSYRNNLSQTDISGAWPLSDRWEVLGQWNYNWSHDHLQAYLYGVEYNTCCWAFRAVINRVFTGLNPSFHSQYDTRFYLQFALKGFTRLGAQDPSGVLLNNIPGYNNYFGEDY